MGKSKRTKPAPATKGKPKKGKPKKGGFAETLKTIVYALAIALFIRTFFVQAFRIPSESMRDTLLIGDFLLVDKITYGAKVPFTDWRLPGFREPRRGDIIVFKEWNANRDYIKRCVATAGETIEVRDNDVRIDGESIQEPYKKTRPGRAIDYPARKVPQGTIFMMGDNRNNSQDSRARNHGPLPMDRVVGRALVLYWSTDPSAAPGWVRRMSESWLKGLLQLVLGRPRITRIGKWLAKDYSEVYAQSSGGSFGAAEAAEIDPKKGAEASVP
jgi:signal peptidase I